MPLTRAASAGSPRSWIVDLWPSSWRSRNTMTSTRAAGSGNARKGGGRVHHPSPSAGRDRGALLPCNHSRRRRMAWAAPPSSTTRHRYSTKLQMPNLPNENSPRLLPDKTMESLLPPFCSLYRHGRAMRQPGRDRYPTSTPLSMENRSTQCGFATAHASGGEDDSASIGCQCPTIQTLSRTRTFERAAGQRPKNPRRDSWTSFRRLWTRTR
mmetsp:Transcript_15238/g.31593  ORF Transcript_15238/g.31593 Transcript_15238/m.31593 type:complete len:211 (+) Transcript_15238:510-1142(+)